MDCRKLLIVTACITFAPFVSGCQCCLNEMRLEREYHPSECNDDWDPILGTCNTCGQCGGNGCPGFTPAMYLKHMKTCAAGGGEIYWNEWISDPPDDCDPCDECGQQWIGPKCCPPKFWERWRMGLSGHRWCETCNSPNCSGGAECDGLIDSEYESIAEEGEVIEASPMQSQPSQMNPRSTGPRSPIEADPKSRPKAKSPAPEAVPEVMPDEMPEGDEKSAPEKAPTRKIPKQNTAARQAKLVTTRSSGVSNWSGRNASNTVRR